MYVQFWNPIIIVIQSFLLILNKIYITVINIWYVENYLCLVKRDYTSICICVTFFLTFVFLPCHNKRKSSKLEFYFKAYNFLTDLFPIILYILGSSKQPKHMENDDSVFLQKNYLPKERYVNSIMTAWLFTCMQPPPR